MNSKPNRHIIHFTCPITEYYVSQFIDRVLQALASNAMELEVHMSSTGGSLHAGFTAYNFIRSLPILVHMHNIGNIESIAVILYLAADNRTACGDSRFLLHHLNWTYNASTYVHSQVNEHLKSLDFDVDRYAQIFQERTNFAKLPVDICKALMGTAEIISAHAAHDAGITTLSTPATITIDASSTRWWVSTIP